jgi:hypothetical protein
MKITTTQLRQIIREEIKKVKLHEGKPSSSEIQIIKDLMNKHKGANPKTGFVPFGKAIEKALPKLSFDYATGNPNEGLRHGTNWAIDNYNFPEVKADAEGTPSSHIYAKGGPGNNWILRKW